MTACLWRLVISLAAVLGGVAAFQRGHGFRRDSRIRVLRNLTTAATANSSISNRSVVDANSSSAAALAKANPTPARLRICNAYSSSDTLTVTLGDPVRATSSGTPYKACAEIKAKLKAGDTVKVHLGSSSTGLYLPYDPYAKNSVVMLVVSKKAGVSTPDMKMFYFRNLRYPQAAVVDVAPAGTPTESIALRHFNPKEGQQQLEYGQVGPIELGGYEVLLNGQPAKHGAFTADWGESYAIMRSGLGEVFVHPGATTKEGGFTFSGAYRFHVQALNAAMLLVLAHLFG